MSDDEIAALDGNWEKIQPADRAAFEFTLKLTRGPHLVNRSDVAALGKHFTPMQINEITQSVAGYNSTNRWTDTLNIPAEESGAFFRRTDQTKPNVELDSFLTPTSDLFAKQKSSLAPMKATDSARPPLGPFDGLATQFKLVARRDPVLPLAPGDAEPAWVRLLKTFPVANKSKISALQAAETKGKLDLRSKLLVAWTTARQDRAWYMLDLIAKRMAAAGIGMDELKRIDSNATTLSDKDRAVITLAQKMAVAPWTITDTTVAALRAHFSDFQVAEIVMHGCNAAFMDRVTETAQLPLENHAALRMP